MDPSGHEPCASGNWGDCPKSKTFNGKGQDITTTQLDGVNTFTQILELLGYETGMLGAVGPLDTISEGYVLSENGYSLEGGSIILSGLTEFAGIYAEYGEPIDKFIGAPSTRTSFDKTLGGAAIIGSAILEDKGRQLYLDKLEAQGANSAMITKMRYESTMSSHITMGEVHPLTLPSSLTVQIFGGRAIETQAEILTISNYAATPIGQNAIRSEPTLREIVPTLKIFCNSLGGRC
jgi:hypothetical protein